MSNTTPPLGYQVIPEAETVRDLVDVKSADKALSIAKSAIQGWINSFLDPQGKNRNFMTAMSGPAGLQFVTNLSYDEEMRVHPNQKKLYLNRFFAENVGRLPAILIIDSGVEHVDPGINDLVGSRYRDGHWEGTYLFYLRLSLSIVAATLSEEDTDTLGSMLLLMFSCLADAVSNYVIREPGAPWEVRLPPTIQATQSTSSPIEGDSKTSVWTRGVDLNCEIETHIVVRQPEPFFVLPPEAFTNGLPSPQIMNLAPNQAIPLGAPYTLIVNYLPVGYTLGISDPNVALISPDVPYTIYPRKRGRAVLYIKDPHRFVTESATGPSTGGAITPTVVLDIPFRVV